MATSSSWPASSARWRPSTRPLPSTARARSPACISLRPHRMRTSLRHPEPIQGTPMNKGLAIPFVLLLALSFAGTSIARDDAGPTALASQLLDHLDAGRYADAEAMFT